MRNWRPDVVTTHGARRLRKRVKLPARATVRHLATVRAEGLRPEQLTGPARMKLMIVRDEHHNEARPTEYLVYREHVYIFDLATGALITCYPLSGVRFDG